MLLVGPAGNAGGLHNRAHRAAVVGSVEQKRFDQGGIARHETTAQTGHVAAFGQAGQGDQVFEVCPAQLRCRLQSAQRRLVPEIDLAVALVRGNHKTVAVAELEQQFPFINPHHRAGRVARRADKQQLGFLPHSCGHGGPVDAEVARRLTRREPRLRTGQQRCTFVDLIKRIRADHGRSGLAGVQHRLRQRKQRLARAVNRQDLRRRIDFQAPVAPGQPVAHGLPQFGLAQGTGVARQTGQATGQSVLDQLRRCMAGFANAQADGLVGRIGRDVGMQLAQPLERVGLKAGEQGVHAGGLSSLEVGLRRSVGVNRRP